MRLQQKIFMRLFSKNLGLCQLERGSIGTDACPMPEGHVDWLSQFIGKS